MEDNTDFNVDNILNSLNLKQSVVTQEVVIHKLTRESLSLFLVMNYDAICNFHAMELNITKLYYRMKTLLLETDKDGSLREFIHTASSTLSDFPVDGEEMVDEALAYYHRSDSQKELMNAFVEEILRYPDRFI